MEGETDKTLLVIVGLVGLVAVVAMGLSTLYEAPATTQGAEDPTIYALGAEPLVEPQPPTETREQNYHARNPTRVGYLLAP